MLLPYSAGPSASTRRAHRAAQQRRANRVRNATIDRQVKREFNPPKPKPTSDKQAVQPTGQRREKTCLTKHRQPKTPKKVLAKRAARYQQKKAAAKSYQKQYRQAHKAAVKAYNKKYQQATKNCRKK